MNNIEIFSEDKISNDDDGGDEIGSESDNDNAERSSSLENDVANEDKKQTTLDNLGMSHISI